VAPHDPRASWSEESEGPKGTSNAHGPWRGPFHLPSLSPPPFLARPLGRLLCAQGAPPPQERRPPDLREGRRRARGAPHRSPSQGTHTGHHPLLAPLPHHVCGRNAGPFVGEGWEPVRNLALAPPLGKGQPQPPLFQPAKRYFFSWADGSASFFYVLIGYVHGFCIACIMCNLCAIYVVYNYGFAQSCVKLWTELPVRF